MHLPYVYRVPLCLPFWNWRTYAALVRSGVFGRIVVGPDISRLEDELAALFVTPSAVACSSGRAALELALRASGVGTGDEVIVPTFCCTSIIPPVLAAGATPVLADVGDQLSLTPETVGAACTPRTRAVVIAHLFGNPAPIDAVEAFCKRRSLILIDDAAQALGARLNGQLVGTFGDTGILSFGKGKICFGVGGGALLSRDAEALARARNNPFPSDNLAKTVKRAATVMLWRRWRRWSLPLQVALTRWRGISSDSEYAAHAMANVDAAVASSLLRTLGANLAMRRARVEEYRQLLGEETRISLLPHSEGSACLTQVVSFDSNKQVAIEIVRVLREAGYEVGQSYQPLHLQGPYQQYKRAALPYAERVWEGLVELPCEPSVQMEDVRRIAGLVRASINARNLSAAQQPHQHLQ